MKLAIVVIFSLVCHMAIAGWDGKVCQSSSFYWNGTACNACPTGCTECIWKNNAVSCIDCGSNSAKYLKLVNDLGTCDNCTANCNQCRGPAVTDCTKPADSYLVSPTAITKCTVAGCKYCDSNGACLQCEFGNRLANGTCTACSGQYCADCSDSVSTCKKCTFMTQLSNGACSPCTEGCSSCPCTTCLPGYRFNNSACTKCSDSNCNTCATNTSSCDTCRAGFFANVTCQNCADGCYNCTSSTKCNACSPGYVLNGTNCSKCPDSCNQCDTSGNCSTCATGYSLSSDKKSCIKCPSFCTLCNNTNTCIQCGSASNPDGKGNCKSFSTCQKGQQLDGSGNCTTGTIDNCVYGNNVTGTCFLCSPGYYENGKTCTPCPNGCESCTVDTDGSVHCTQLAQPGFSIVKTSGKTDVTGYQMGAINTVILNGTVDTCMPNFYVASPLSNLANKQCVASDKCTYPMQMKGDWVCFTNAVKITISLFVVVVGSLFTL